MSLVIIDAEVVKPELLLFVNIQTLKIFLRGLHNNSFLLFYNEATTILCFKYSKQHVQTVHSITELQLADKIDLEVTWTATRESLTIEVSSMYSTFGDRGWTLQTLS